jgi:hypothetical protein
MTSLVQRTVAVALSAAGLLSACGTDTIVYPGGPAGPPVAVSVSNGRFVMHAGESAALGVRGEDEAGNPVPSVTPTFQACDAGVASVAGGAATDQWTATATVSAVALGETCLIVTVGSLPPETILVNVGPARLVIAGPDTVLSGSDVAFTLQFYSQDGTQLTAPSSGFPTPAVVSLKSLGLPLTATSAIDYTAPGQQPGPVELQVVMDPLFGGVTANKIVEVVPGVFGGTISATTAAVQGGPILVTRDPAFTWDGDETVRIGNYIADNWDGTAGGAFRASWYADSIVFWIPAPVPAGTYDLVIADQGPTQVAGAVSFTVTGTATPNRQAFPGNNTPGASLEDKPLPLRFPVVHNLALGTTTYYTMAPSGADFVFTALLQFACPGDLDIQFIDGDFTVFMGDRSGETLACPEATVWSVADGAFNFLRIQTFEATDRPAQLTLFEGCVAGIANGIGDAVDDTDNWEDAGC